MARFGAIVRLFMLAACLVPFTSSRHAAAFLPISPDLSPAPIPVQEEEETQRDKDTPGTEGRRSAPPPCHASAVSVRQVYPPPFPTGPVAPRSPAPVDPFRNGLGCPIRC
jgi:hypothetical protein